TRAPRVSGGRRSMVDLPRRIRSGPPARAHRPACDRDRPLRARLRHSRVAGGRQASPCRASEAHRNRADMDREVEAAGAPHIAIAHAGGGVSRLRLSGRWTLDAPAPSVADLFEHAGTTTAARISVESERRLQWDSSLLIFLREVLAEAQRRAMSVDVAGLPDGARRMLALASATPEHTEAGMRGDRLSVLGRLGARAVAAWRAAGAGRG